MSILISGCTNHNAINYNPDATYNDGSCMFVSGCTQSNATNYNPIAVIDDGSCICSNYRLRLRTDVINEDEDECRYFFNIKFQLQIDCSDILDYFNENEVTLKDIINDIKINFLYQKQEYNLLTFNNIHFIGNECDTLKEMYAIENQLCDEEVNEIFNSNCIIEKTIELDHLKFNTVFLKFSNININIENIYVKHEILVKSYELFSICEYKSYNCYFSYNDIISSDNNCTGFQLDPVNFINDHIYNYYANNISQYPHNIIYNQGHENFMFFPDFRYSDYYLNSLKLYYDYISDICSESYDYKDVLQIYNTVNSTWRKKISEFIDANDINCIADKTYKNNSYHNNKFKYKKYKTVIIEDGETKICYEPDDINCSYLTEKTDCLNTTITYDYYNNSGFHTGNVFVNDVSIITDNEDCGDICTDVYQITVNPYNETTYTVDARSFRNGYTDGQQYYNITLLTNLDGNNISTPDLIQEQKPLNMYNYIENENPFSLSDYFDKFNLRYQDNTLEIDLNPETVLSTYSGMSNQYSQSDYYYGDNYTEVLRDTIQYAINEFINNTNTGVLYDFDVVEVQQGIIRIIFYVIGSSPIQNEYLLGLSETTDSYISQYIFNINEQRIIKENPVFIRQQGVFTVTTPTPCGDIIITYQEQDFFRDSLYDYNGVYQYDRVLFQSGKPKFTGNNSKTCAEYCELSVSPIIEGDQYMWSNGETRASINVRCDENDISVSITNKNKCNYVIYKK